MPNDSSLLFWAWSQSCHEPSLCNSENFIFNSCGCFDLAFMSPKPMSMDGLEPIMPSVLKVISFFRTTPALCWAFVTSFAASCDPFEIPRLLLLFFLDQKFEVYKMESRSLGCEQLKMTQFSPQSRVRNLPSPLSSLVANPLDLAKINRGLFLQIA